METVSAARGVHPLPSQSPLNSSRSAGSEHGRELADGDFCSSTTDESLDNDNLHQQLYAVARQREDLQLLQIELHARIIARSGLMDMLKTFDDQFKEHANAYAKLQEKLHHKEQVVHELEKRIEEKDRELHVVKLDNEAAWAKEGLLREQNKELQTYRKERDNSEAERSQHLKQIDELQEHIQDREQQLIELQEQNKVAQEAIMYKDEQLREAQTWIARAQEMDALQSTTNHNLQAELRERTEQYNQLWMACQRQFGEVERLHAHTVQQLQFELVDARERIGAGADESHVSRTNSNDTSQFVQNGNQFEANGSVTSSGNSADFPNGNVENFPSHVQTGNTSIQAERAHGVAIPSPLPPAQVAALHPFIVHHQGVQSVPTVSALQYWQNKQALPEDSQLSTISAHIPSQNLAYEASVNGQAVRPESLEVHFRQGWESSNVYPPSAVVGQVDISYLASVPSQESLQRISSQFHDALPLKSEAEEKTITNSPNHVLESQESISERTCSPVLASSVTAVPHASTNETTVKGSVVASSETFVSSGQKNVLNSENSSETVLLDERSLLACIVRTIPPGSGGGIRISSTLPNRLGKMLAPLHWHDYKKFFGKLEDFVAGHPELFLVEGDYIQLREGAQEIIAATAAVAKVAAAAKTASSPYSSTLPSVAVTPMAQSYLLQREPSIESNHSHSSVRSQLANGNTNVKVLKDKKDLNGGESRHGHSSKFTAVNSERSGLGNFLSKGTSHGSSGTNSIGKQQDRRSGISLNSRR